MLVGNLFIFFGEMSTEVNLPLEEYTCPKALLLVNRTQIYKQSLVVIATQGPLIFSVPQGKAALSFLPPEMILIKKLLGS